MSVIAVAVRHLMAAGVTGEQLVEAIAAMEAAQAPVVSKGAIRMRRLRARKAEEASQSVTRDESDAPSLPSEVSPQTPLPNLPTLPPPSPPKGAHGSKSKALTDLDLHSEAVWQAATQTSRHRSSRKKVRIAVAAALKAGATVEALKASVAAVSERQGEYAKGVHYLIDAEHWRDETRPPGLFSTQPDLWPIRVKGWRESRYWLETWGPPPGDPKCQVPPNLLEPSP